MEELETSSTRQVTKENAADIWEQTAVARYLDTNTVRVALLLATQMHYIKDRPFDGGYSTLHHKWMNYLNSIMEIMEKANEFRRANTRPELLGCYVELVAFVWSAWQRSLTLILADIVHERLAFGWTGGERGVNVPELARTTSRLSNCAKLPSYICPWAFGMLRTNAFACGGDLRTAIARCAEYCLDLDLVAPRCISPSTGAAQQCSGETIEECRRFAGVHVDDQSAHTESCSDHHHCAQNRLFWDPSSYKSVSGGRAVSIASLSSNRSVAFCSASERTLTVSHVWSHGQGGRPENTHSGFNACLHQRYCRLALKHGCDSYWIDTMCIPSDYNLRKEAIAEINQTFSNGKITLVCDKDIMRLDVSSLTIELQERILSMVLVCDWNQRAWTFLEAMRGRNHLHVLCKDEQTVSLKFLLENVLSKGSLDLISLFADAHHLVPNRQESLRQQVTTAQVRQNLAGMVELEEAACLLSRRHASRAGDEVVIWSLLSGGEPHQTAEAFWRQHLADDPLAQGAPGTVQWILSQRISYKTVFRSAFLVSSAPRLQIDGLRWAPTRPAPDAQMQLDGRKRAFHPVRGETSVPTFLYPHGLEGEWQIFSFATTSQVDTEEPWWQFPFNRPRLYNSWLFNQRQVEAKYLRSYRYGALLKPLSERDEFRQKEVYKVHTEDNEVLVVVAGSNTDLDTWTWIAVIAWPHDEGLAVGSSRRITLV